MAKVQIELDLSVVDVAMIEGDPDMASERDTLSAMPMAAIIAGIAVIAAYTDEDGNLPNNAVADAFHDALVTAYAFIENRRKNLAPTSLRR